jgi:hypothetical protein
MSSPGARARSRSVPVLTSLLAALAVGVAILIPGVARAQTPAITSSTTTSSTTTSSTTTSSTTSSTTSTSTTTTVPTSTSTTSPSGPPAVPTVPTAYWMVGADGAVYAFGSAPYDGSEAGHHLGKPIVGMAGMPGAAGYWLVSSGGGIFNFGAAHFYGSTGAIKLNQPIVGMAPTPDGHGYWMVASDGGIFTFGDAGFFGSTGAIKLNKPIVGMAATPDGLGYYLVASDGGVFTFGDAVFHGSTGALKLAKPIVGMSLTPDGAGYWMVASDGGIFTFGDAGFSGSLGALKLNQPIVGMALPTGGGGYWLAAADGGIFTFGAAVFHGSLGGKKVAAPIVGIVATPSLDPYVPATTGYDISFPQCPNSNIPSQPQPVGVVGVDGGASFKHNPCLATEAAWARQDGLTVYMNVNSPFVNQSTAGATGPHGVCGPTDGLCVAFNYGYNAAVDAYDYAQSVGVTAPMWWLDVEGPAGSGNPLWSNSTAANDQVIGGAISALTTLGVEPGIYSTITQWDEIAGSSYQPAVPAWRAGAVSLSGAQALCNQGTFTAGRTYLVQFGSPNPWDRDYAC